MKRFLLFVICICCVTQGFSQNKSSVKFIVRNLGIGVDGQFNDFGIVTDFDHNGELLNITGEIKAISIETGIENRDKHLLKAHYFDIDNHEKITLSSKAVSAKLDGTYDVTAVITIKGKTKNIPITVKLEKLNNQYVITSNFEINRTHFSIGGENLFMSDIVKIEVIHYHNL